MNAGMSTATVFALFYAIVFGGILRRLSGWSAFWRNNRYEPFGIWVPRVVFSYAMFNVFPAIYFGIALYLLGGRQVPSDLCRLLFWSIGIFCSVLFLPACYRLWAAIVIWCDLHPWQEQEINRYISPGAGHYLRGAMFPLVASVLALLITAFCV
jgi:hypothetical protein